MNRATLLYVHPGRLGWFPIQLFAQGAAKLLEAHYVELPDPGTIGRVRKVIGELPRRTSRRGPLILVAPNPNHLAYAASLGGFLRGWSSVDAFVIDSFWHDRIPHMAKRANLFDRIWITDGELIDTWTAATKTDVRWLPWGTWALGRAVATERPVDLQRYGRQPGGWDNDEAVASLATRMGLVYRGRPPFAEDGALNQQLAFTALGAAKFSLAFSSLVDHQDYTSATHGYITGRWTDSLNLGCSVAGLTPDTRTRHEVLWEDGLLDFASLDPEEGLGKVAQAISAWTPDRARANHARAVERLDWGWRVERLADAAGLTAPKLQRYLDRARSSLG